MDLLASMWIGYPPEPSRQDSALSNNEDLTHRSGATNLWMPPEGQSGMPRHSTNATLTRPASSESLETLPRTQTIHPPSLTGPSAKIDSDRRSKPEGKSSSFRTDIQGLRALAVTLVILAHAKLPHFSGGFVGVDVFFVISGYVITGVLIRQSDAPFRQKISSFYRRRIRRILPASALVLVVTLIATYHWLGPLTGQSLGGDERWASLFSVNWHFIFIGTNYLSSQQPPSVILNYWSLAVEEQFYLVYPLVIYLIWAAFRSKHRHIMLIASLVVIVATSAVWCAVQTKVDPVAAYYSPFTRVWELALGGLIAVLPVTLSRSGRRGNALLGWAAALLGWIALAVIVISALVFNDSTSYPGVAVWWPVGATALLLLVGKSRSCVGPELLLSRRPLVFIGEISFGLYLWHYPLLMIPMQYSSSSEISVISRLELIGLAFILAVTSYYLFENRIRRSKWLDRRRMATYAVGIGLILVVWVATGLATNPVTLGAGTSAAGTPAVPNSLSNLLDQINRSKLRTSLPDVLYPSLNFFRQQ